MLHILTDNSQQALSVIPEVHIPWDFDGPCLCGRNGGACGWGVFQDGDSCFATTTTRKGSTVIIALINSAKLNINMWQRSYWKVTFGPCEEKSSTPLEKGYSEIPLGGKLGTGKENPEGVCI